MGSSSSTEETPVVTTLNEQTVEQLRLEFQEMDLDHNGSVSWEELAKQGGATVSPAMADELKRMFSQMDADHDGKVSLQEYVSYIEQQHLGPQAHDESQAWSLQTLKDKFTEYGQEHCFRFESDLSAEEKQELISSLSAIDLADIDEKYKASQSCDASSDVKTITPFPEVTIASQCTSEEQSSWRQRTLEAISAGEVAVILMAGGQGTRLGSSAPKGCYDVGLPSGKSLFQIQMERVRCLIALAQTEGKAAPSLPVYLMTSPATDAPTRSYFQENKFFGLPEGDVVFFQQGMLPCLSANGKIMMQTKTTVALAPDGNGGIYKGLAVSGSLADMKRRGVKYTHVFGVDNILIKVGDPAFVGHSIIKGSTCANKVVMKTRPHEKVGVMCLKSGRPGVVEYSEITKEMAEMRDEKTGHLVYSAGNIAQHYFTVAFLEEVTTAPFLIHVAKKNIPSVNDEGKECKQPGIKLEMFIFDSFSMSQAMTVFAVPRSSEFSGVKNKSGRDSPFTARDALSSYHIQLARRAGAIIERAADIHPAAFEGPPETPTSNTHPGSLPCPAPTAEGLLEISGLVTYDGEGLSALSGRTITLPSNIASL